VTGWHLGPMALFDSESTGIDVHHDRIVTGSIIRGGRGVQPTVTNLLLDPGIPIPEAASRIHGVTTEQARAEGLRAGDGVDEIAFLLAGYLKQNIPVVGFNIVYDLSLLHAECVRHGVKTLTERLGYPVGPVICARVLDKHVSWRKGPRKLIDVAAQYGISLSEKDAHGAEADARAAGNIAWAIAVANPKIAERTLMELHHDQIGWCAEQCASLQEYFRRKDPSAVVNGEWPVQSLPPGWDPAAVPLVKEAVAS
jgi:DNA polymerase III subunit epsilon